MFLDIINLFLKTKAKINSTVFIIMYSLSSSKCFTSAFSPTTTNYLNIFLSAFLSHDFSPWLLFVLQPKTDVLASSFHMFFNQQYFWKQKYNTALLLSYLLSASELLFLKLTDDLTLLLTS